MWVQVLLRYVFNIGLPWAEEIAKYFMVWSAMLGAAVVLYENGHIAVDFLFNKLAEKQRNWIKTGHLLLALILFGIMAYFGWTQAIFGLDFKSPTTGITRFWPYLSIFVGGFFMLLFSIHLLMSHLRDHYFNKKEQV